MNCFRPLLRIAVVISAVWAPLSILKADEPIRESGGSSVAIQKIVSHPPLRRHVAGPARPLPDTPVFFVDAAKGNDEHDGSQERPWRTLKRSIAALRAGDTLCLRGGVYREPAYVALAGEENKPITIRSFPGETAIIDGALREFFDAPETAWVPVDSMTATSVGEYRSARPYPNLREVLASFGDSQIGLQTYYHAQDLRSQNELIDWEDWEHTDKTDLKPLYCGPGLWYDRATGYIYARLAHTNLPEPVPNYRGETDPRKVPLLIAPFNSVPLHLDNAEHVRLQDLVIRGAGYTAVVLDHARAVEFDGVTVWCGAYGLRASRTVGLRFLNSALYGNVAPWTFRSDGSKRDYPGRPHRNLSRLNTHSLIETEAGGESSVYATPQNDHWEFAHSEFTDAHDALYFGGISVRFHHNLVDNLQDDGIYLSPMYFRFRLDNTVPEIHIYQNVFTRVLTALAFGGPAPETKDNILVYRNVFDVRGVVQTGRPSTRDPAVGLTPGKLMGDHGSPPWPAMRIYHNTCIMANQARDAAMASVGGNRRAGNERRTFNNIFYHVGKLPRYVGPNSFDNVIEDGNLFGATEMDEKLSASSLDRYRAGDWHFQSKAIYAAGSATHSFVAQPAFQRLVADLQVPADFRLLPVSPAANAGVELPAEWPDPLRAQDMGKPDVGAFPTGAEELRVGRLTSR